jgi:hypothetical protein
MNSTVTCAADFLWTLKPGCKLIEVSKDYRDLAVEYCLLENSDDPVTAPIDGNLCSGRRCKNIACHCRE